MNLKLSCFERENCNLRTEQSPLVERYRAEGRGGTGLARALARISEPRAQPSLEGRRGEACRWRNGAQRDQKAKQYEARAREGRVCRAKSRAERRTEATATRRDANVANSSGAEWSGEVLKSEQLVTSDWRRRDSNCDVHLKLELNRNSRSRGKGAGPSCRASD